jgi:hypothetical protein
MEQEALGHKYGVYAIDWVMFIPYWLFFSSLIVCSIASHFHNFSLLLPLSLAMLSLYFLLVLCIRQLRPRFHLYENGLIVLHRGQKSTWTWDEITHFEGQRQKDLFWRTGANDFYAGDEFAFRVGALTGEADILAEYIISRMIEKRIPETVAVVRNGQRVQFNSIVLDSKGLKNVREFFEWDDIISLDFNNDGLLGVRIVFAEVAGRKAKQNLGGTYGTSAYLMMGVIDALRGTKYLPTAQGYIADSSKRIRLFWRTSGWKLAVIFISAIAFLFAVFYFGGYY